MTQALTKPDETTKAVSEWEGFEPDGTEDIAPSFPYIKIVQATSTMSGASKHAGDFYRSDTETYHNPLEVVALFQKTTRAIFEEGSNTPLCRSGDGIAPAPGQSLWDYEAVNLGQGRVLEVPDIGQPLACADCPFFEWGEDGTPPPCRESIVVLVDHEGELAQLRIGGKSMGIWKRMIARRLKPRKLPLCSQKLFMTTVEKSEPGKKWQELEINAEDLPKSEAMAYNAVLAYERQRFQQDTGVEPEGDGWDTPAPRDVTPDVTPDVPLDDVPEG